MVTDIVDRSSFDMEASLGFARAVVTRTYSFGKPQTRTRSGALQKLIFPEASASTERCLELP